MKLYKKLILTVLACFFAINFMTAQEEKLPTFFSDNTTSVNQLTSIDQIKTKDLFNLNNNNANRETNDFVELNQIGNENVIKLDLPNNGIQSVTQFGNENYYGFTKYLNNTPTSLKVKQYGDSNSLKVLGNNSLINNLTITQTRGASLTIINY